MGPEGICNLTTLQITNEGNFQVIGMMDYQRFTVCKMELTFVG